MLTGELNSRDRLNGELTGGVFYGTNDYTELINKPAINSVELTGDKTLEDLGINIPTELSELTNDVGFITSADVPTKTSELDNDSGFITAADVSAAGLSGDYDDLTNKPTIPTLTSQLTNDSGFITNAQVPTMTSQLFNDSGFITSADVPTKTSELDNDSGFITSADVPTKTSELDNDSGFITAADIPTDISAFTNDAGYITAADLIPETASGSIATFTDGGDDIPVSEYECEIVAQQASGTPTPDNPLPITGFSQADIVVGIDSGTIEQGGFDDDGRPQDSGGNVPIRIRTADFIAVEPNTTYFINWLSDNVNQYGVNGYSQPNHDNARVYNTAWTNKGVTFTTNASTNYIKIGFRTSSNSNISPSDISLVTVSRNLYTVAFGQTIYGGRLIYKNGQWSIEATHGYVDLGDLTWSKGTISGYTIFSANVTNKANNALCSCYNSTNKGRGDLLDNEIGLWNTVGTYTPCIRDDSKASLTPEQFKSAVNGQLLTFELATSVIIPITSATRVKTISGVNNIFSNTGDNSVKYFMENADSLAELIKAFVV